MPRVVFRQDVGLAKLFTFKNKELVIRGNLKISFILLNIFTYKILLLQISIITSFDIFMVF